MHSANATILPPLLLLLCATCPGQSKDAIGTPFGRAAILPAPQAHDEATRLIVWVGYQGGERRHIADHRQYLQDLQQRFKDKGVRVRVIVPPDQRPAAAAGNPSYEIATWANGEPSGAELPNLFVTHASGEVIVGWTGVDGVLDFTAKAVEGTLVQADPERISSDISTDAGVVLQAQLSVVADAEAKEAYVRHCLRILPRSGRANALATLYQWWCKGDLEAGRQSAQAGLRAIAGDMVPLVEFADLVLRGGHDEPALAKRIAIELAPAAAMASDSVWTQLVYLRALLRSGQDRLAGRVIATLPKKISAEPSNAAWHQLVFAETLMEGSAPAAYRDTAMHALDACAGKVSARLHAACTHKVLVRTGAPTAEVDAMLTAYLGSSDHTNYGLNNDAWYLMVEIDTMGRFDPLAGALCEKMLADEGADISPGNRDTAALALYRNGKLERAVEEQQKATAAVGGQEAYAMRLRRFEAALAAGKAQDEKR